MSGSQELLNDIGLATVLKTAIYIEMRFSEHAEVIQYIDGMWHASRPLRKYATAEYEQFDDLLVAYCWMKRLDAKKGKDI